MEKEALIAAIKTIVHDRNIRLISIEKELSMPENYLSAILNNKRGFPVKWQLKLTTYLAKMQLVEQPATELGQADDPVAPVTDHLPETSP